MVIKELVRIFLTWTLATLTASECRKGRYSLGARALLELKPYLEETYEEQCLECIICHDVNTSQVPFAHIG